VGQVGSAIQEGGLFSAHPPKDFLHPFQVPPEQRYIPSNGEDKLHLLREGGAYPLTPTEQEFRPLLDAMTLRYIKCT